MCVCFFWLCSPSPGDSGCFLTGWPPYLLSGHDLQVGSAWFLSCHKSGVEFFRSSHTSDYLFLFLTVWSAYLGRPPRMLHRRGSRFNKKRGWKGEKNKHRLIRVDKSSPVSFRFFPFGLPWQSHQTGQMTPEPGSYAPRFLEKSGDARTHVCVIWGAFWKSWKMIQGRKWTRGIDSVGEREELRIQTEERRCISCETRAADADT